MDFKRILLLLFLFVLIQSSAQTRLPFGPEDSDDEVGTRWAVLVAGSNTIYNYRHQADVCHAYQILKKGGLKDENIVVFMYDDIANNPLNPIPGIIINHPNGSDVYAGVPKDYTGEQVTAENFYAVLLGNKTALKGGSGKVVNSKPEDRIFIYYVDHGGPGVLEMPTGPDIYANDLIDVLKKKHAAKGYKEMVMYVEACYAGSVFEGVLPKDINVYVTTASNANENSYATYRQDGEEPLPDIYLGDLYSVAWMEDSETHNLKKETIMEQYNTVKERTSKNNTYFEGSHVMEYGSTNINQEKLYLYQGSDPASEKNFPGSRAKLSNSKLRHAPSPMSIIKQQDADLLYMWLKYKKAMVGTQEQTEGLNQMIRTMKHRVQVDGSVSMISTLLFGPKHSDSILNSVRPAGLPLVDDWNCLKSMVGIFETHCGALPRYGKKHTRAFANMCNKKATLEEMQRACAIVCQGRDV